MLSRTNLLFFFFFFFFFFFSASLLLLIPQIAMAEQSSPTTTAASSSPASASESAVHIVYTEQPQNNEEPEAYHIRTLASVLGSEEAAKEALVYSYKNAASGFSAKLTPEQVSQIAKQPGVLQVVPNRKLELHSGKGMLH
ncbi:Peptidase S8, subtilisin-related [Parasponia andersonii]|uniref:Peptidase S8, subtilisin-related n=1 Tax=Parasponia andersonii TaxID=3476 RepID=A0A2P5AJ41_PARAD|nr:Peptidase S8, subtilisin-related [Parasponia andersonii]